MQLALRCFMGMAASFLITSCSALKQCDDPNYTLCQQMAGQIQFGGNTSYTRQAHSQKVERRRLQSSYDKMDCQKYQLLRL